jgi:hypothetical protein
MKRAFLPNHSTGVLHYEQLIVLEEGRRSRLIMSTLFAFIATVLTSFLPICNKYLLRDARPALVAWIINAASLPLLVLGTLALTQCTLIVPSGHRAVGCRWQPLQVDRVFVLALLASAMLNWAATLLSTKRWTRRMLPW